MADVEVERVAVEQQEERRDEEQDHQRPPVAQDLPELLACRRRASFASCRRPLDDVEEHVFERRLDRRDRRRPRCPRRSSAAASAAASIARARCSTACTAVPNRLVFSTSGMRVEQRASPRPAAPRAPRRSARSAKTLLQLGGRAERRQPAGVDDRDAVAVLGLVQVVRRDEHGDAAARRASSISRQNCAARHRIDAAGRLVEKHDRRLVEDGAAEREPLAPAAGEIARQRASRGRARPAISSTNARRASKRCAARGRRCRRRSGCSDRRSAPRRARTAATCSRCAA